MEVYKKVNELPAREIMERYPRITAHIIAESLGYATPTCAARILKDAMEGKENHCEWIYSCYNKNLFKLFRIRLKEGTTIRDLWLI